MEWMSCTLTLRSHSLSAPQELTRVLEDLTSPRILCLSLGHVRPCIIAMLTSPKMYSGIHPEILKT